MKITIRPKDILIISLGTLIMNLGFFFFLMPTNLVIGGASGFALVVNHFLPMVPVSIILLITNVLLLILGYFKVGREFGGLTLFTAILTSGILFVLEQLLPNYLPITDDLLINLIFGVLISGLGLAIVLNQGASTGGTDILAKVMEQHSTLSFGQGLLIIDGLITLGAFVAFGPHLGLYALLGVILNSFFIDKVVAGFNSKYHLTIYTTYQEEIIGFILNDLGRAATLYKAEGAYSRETKEIIDVILERDEYLRLKSFLHEKDPTAFVYVANVTEVEGEGFTFW